jgi:hypothetical protein
VKGYIMTRSRSKLGIAIILMCGLATVAGLTAAEVRSGSGEGSSDTLLEVKAAASSRVDQEQKEHRANDARTAKPGRTARPQSRPDPKPPAPGLMPVSSPFSSGQYLVGELGWQEVRGARTKIVYAGALAPDPSQGIVIVTTWVVRASSDATAAAGPAMTFVAHLTPAKVGPVEIVAADGSVLTLRTSDGTKPLRFDVATGAFLS